VKVTYVITDPIADTNTITIELPNDWEAAYANDGDSAVTAGFGTAAKGGTASDQDIDLDGATGPPVVAAVHTVTSLPAGTTTAMRSKASYVTVQYTPRGTSMNEAAVSINSNEVMISVTGDMAARDRIIVTYHNVKVPALADRTAMDADIMVTDALSSTAYDGMAQIRVNPLPLNTVAVTPAKVKAETITDVKVTYSIKSTALDENTITVGLPEGWGPAYLPNDESSRSKSFGNFAESAVPSANRNSTSYVVVTSTLDDSEDNREFTVSGLVSSGANVSLEIDVEDTAANRDNIVVTFYNVEVQELAAAPPVNAMLTVTDTIAGGESFDPTIEVSALQRGAITRLPNMVTAEDELDLRIRYAATDDLADPDPDGDEDTDDATYGRIQIMLPEGWTRMDGAALSDADIAVTGSPNVKFLDPDDDLATKDHIDVTGQMVTIDVDSLEKGKYVELVVDDLRVADFPADNATDTLYVQVEVFSDSFDSEGDRDVELAVHAAHLLSRVAPTVPIATSGLASAAHPTIRVDRKYLGEVTVSPGSVVAERTEDVKIRYTATNNLATPDPAATATDDMNSTYGRIQIMLPEGWTRMDGAALSDADIAVTGSPNVKFLDPDDDLATKDHIDVTGQMVTIDVDSLEKGKYVELVVDDLRVADFPADNATDTLYVQVEVFSDSFDSEGDRDVELAVHAAHLLSRVAPTVPIATSGLASAAHPTIRVDRKYLGEVTVSPGSVVAERTEDVKIRYTATNNLATPDPAATATDDMNSTYGRIQIMLPDAAGRLGPCDRRGDLRQASAQ
jgi:hypothetical protein